MTDFTNATGPKQKPKPDDRPRNTRLETAALIIEIIAGLVLIVATTLAIFLQLSG